MLCRAATFLVVCATLAANPDTKPALAESAQAPADAATTAPATAPPAAPAAEALSPAKPEEVDPFAVPPLPAVAHPTDAQAEGTTLQPREEIQHVQTGHKANSAEIASLLRLARAKREQSDYATAEIAYIQVLVENATVEQDREAMLGLARTYRKKGAFTKAAATYERFVKEFPSDPEIPTIYLELGRTLRALGAFKQAIARFYSVLNATLKMPDEGPDQYRQLVRTAQYEIADTYFQTGDYVQANRYFSRLKLLDLAPEDRARAHFKSVVALMLAGNDDKAVSGLRAYILQNPDDENVPEAQYLLSVSLRRLGRSQESLRTTLDLLKVESTRTKKDPQRWQHWQRKTGNQLANEFYEQGDVESALQIYTSLTQLSSDPAWTLPATYQIGLCSERLRRFDRARECYKSIVDTMKAMKGDTPIRPDLVDLAEMAKWRLSQLTWQLTTDKQLSALFSPAATHPPALLSTSPSASADHDTHGSAPIPSQSLR